MVITYGGLSPGKDYHIRVAGANSVGQVWVDISVGQVWVDISVGQVWVDISAGQEKCE